MKEEFPEMSSIMIKKSEFNVNTKVLDCEGFCPSVGFNVHTLTGPNALNLFVNLRDVIERYRGLEKRDNEIQRICSKDDEECQISQSELDVFHGIIERNKYELRRKEIDAIDKLTKEINQIINENNIDVSEYKEKGKFKIPSKLLAFMFRNNRSIKAKSSILSQRISILAEFDKEFNIKDGKRPKVRKLSESEINSMLSKLTEKDIKRYIEFNM